MESPIQDLRHKYLNEALALRSNVLKFFKSVSATYEEEQRKLKYNDELSRRISAAEAQIISVAAEEAKVQEEKKKINLKNAELNGKLKREISRAEDLQLAVDRDRARIEEQERLAKNVLDRSNLLLKPYHEVLGVTFQLSKESEMSLRVLFQMPNNKKCVVKITKNALKVVKCVPMLKGLDKLETHLAETNDFPGFVTYLRSLFLNAIR